MEGINKHRHFIIDKPWGYLSQFIANETKRKNKKLLGELHSFPIGTMAVGRLDKNSEGLLLLTTDGHLSEYIRSRQVKKEYWVQVDGLITQAAIDKLNNGVKIRHRSESYLTLPSHSFALDECSIPKSKAKEIRGSSHGPTSWVSITINEGKFRQIRKMTAAVGFPTLRLIRVRIGNIKLENMESGDVIEVDAFDL